MEILGIGPLELAFIVIIVLLVLGPKEMVSAMRTIGRVLRSVVTSDWWQTTRQAIQDVRKLPYDLMRDAGMEEDFQALDEIRRTASGTPPQKPKTHKSSSDEGLSAWTNPDPDRTALETNQESEPTILPPEQDVSITLANPPELDENPAEKQAGGQAAPPADHTDSEVKPASDRNPD
ncbi:MAG: twin-arginine translocase TatA/TatE family subunit [Anaerolineales bacterium]